MILMIEWKLILFQLSLIDQLFLSENLILSLKKIITHNQIFIIGELDDKNLNLLKFYLPQAKLIKKEEIPKIETIYGIINDKDIIQFNDSDSSKIVNLKKFKDINLIKIN